MDGKEGRPHEPVVAGPLYPDFDPDFMRDHLRD